MRAARAPAAWWRGARPDLDHGRRYFHKPSPPTRCSPARRSTPVTDATESLKSVTAKTQLLERTLMKTISTPSSISSDVPPGTSTSLWPASTFCGEWAPDGPIVMALSFPGPTLIVTMALNRVVLVYSCMTNFQ